MGKLLWILQAVLGVQFVTVGVLHFIVPTGLPSLMAWMYDLSPALHYASGVVEILGGLGLILPGLLRIQTRLTPLAALGLVLVMIAAFIWHVGRGEALNMAQTLVLGVIAAFVAYGRWKVRPLASSRPAS